jgi:hypothetical protein
MVSQQFEEKIGLKSCPSRAARFFLGTMCQNGKNVLNDNEIYETAIPYTKALQNIPNCREMYQHW